MTGGIESLALAALTLLDSAVLLHLVQVVIRVIG